MFALEIDTLCGKKELGKIVDEVLPASMAYHDTAQVLDNIKNLGFKYSTIGAVTVAVTDIKIPEGRSPRSWPLPTTQVEEINSLYRMGMMSEEERYTKVVDIWNTTTDHPAEHDPSRSGQVQPHPYDDRLRRPR